jgi:uncharacterized membrane protein YkoI
MGTSKVRIIAMLFAILAFGGVAFTVLYAEQDKRIAAQKADREAFLASVGETNRLRQAYFAEVEKKRTEYQQQMDDAKAAYENLVKKQPELIKSQQQTVTKMVTKTVPVVTTVTTQPTAARKTKTS